MASIYFAAPMFCQAELDFNELLALLLRENGHEVYLPQENTPDVDLSPETGKAGRRSVFLEDITAIDNCDTLLFIMDGRVPDEGACFELGYAYAKGKTCVGLKTDVRTSELGGDNMMLEGALHYGIARSVPELLELLEGMY
ncbi:MAG: nucleoside 2-deoxyribosyltransferase [Candidatus Methanomethylophilaceae archaeon]|nr:nucleoside 2-deoxyribosyltransferase [Candidatus Methanomethylophilaceae archaeon]MBR7123546.1 nucleoside 2-deoxyribosyltransferase [Candidatus Methanomethylophilaceae archaeon]